MGTRSGHPADIRVEEMIDRYMTRKNLGQILMAKARVRLMKQDTRDKCSGNVPMVPMAPAAESPEV